MSWNAVEITELTIGDANVGGVHVPVDLPGHFPMRHLFFPELIGHKHQLGEGSIRKKVLAFLHGKPIELERSPVKFFLVHNSRLCNNGQIYIHMVVY
jgi:hypothetical protein